MHWCVIVDDPEAYRPHVVYIEAIVEQDARRIAAIAANHADVERWPEATKNGTPPMPLGIHSSVADFALAYPLTDEWALAYDSPMWPRFAAELPGSVAGEKIPFTIPDTALVSFRPVRAPA